jgi:PAS domain S-box-containing protein
MDKRVLLISDHSELTKKLYNFLNKKFSFSILNSINDNFSSYIVENKPEIVLLDCDIIEPNNLIKIGKTFIENKIDSLFIYIISKGDNRIINKVEKSNFYGFIKKPILRENIVLQIKSAIIHLNIIRKEKQQSEFLEIINKIGLHIRIASNFDDVINRTIEALSKYSKAPLIDLFLYNKSKNILELKAQKGFTDKIIEEINSLSLKNSLSGKSIKNRKIIVVNNFLEEKRVNNKIVELLTKEGIISGIFVPLFYRKKPIGTLHLLYKKELKIEVFEKKFYKIIGNSISIAIGNRMIDKEFKAIVKQYRYLFNESNDAIFVHSIDGQILYVNKKAVNIFGYKKDELLKMTINELPHKDCELCAQATEELKKKGKVRFEAVFKKKSGNPINVEVSSKLINIGDRTVIQGIVRDISDKMKTETELKNKIVYLNLINSITNRLNKSLDTDSIIKTIMKGLSNYKGSPSIILAKIKEEQKYFELLYATGFDKSLKVLSSNPPLKNSLSGLTVLKRKVLFSKDIKSDKRVEPKHKKALLSAGYKSIVSIPLFTKNKTFGVLSLIYKNIISLTKDDFKTLQIIGKGIGIALENVENIEKLRNSEENYRLLADTAKDIIMIHNLKGDKIKYVNKSALKITGYTHDELKKMNLRTIFPPEERERYAKRFKERIKGNFSSFTYTTKFLNKKGELINVEVISSPIIKNGKVDSVLVIARDIRERIKAEESLKILASVVEQATTAVIITDLDGNIEYVNSVFEKTTGYKKDEVIGKNPRILKSGKHNDYFYKKLWKTIKNGKVWHKNIINKKKDGTLYTEEITIFPIFDNSGKIFKFAADFKDITKEQDLENQIRQIQKLEAIGNLTAGIAHDFNNILTSILGYADLLERDFKNNKKDIEKIKIIKKSGEKAKNLVAQLLAYSRKQVIKLEITDINSIINSLKPMLSRIISEDIALEYNLKNSISKIYADKSQLEQILMNLVVNSYDALRETNKKNKRIIIETDEAYLDNKYTLTHLGSKKGKYIVFKISDNGIGMSEDIKRKAFEPFFTTKDVGKGTGLGLSTVYGIIKQNKGNIYLYSEKGKGTTIKIYWPVYTMIRKNSDTYTLNKKYLNKISKNREKFHFKGKALIVEDDDYVREISKEFISHLGFKTYEAKNGVEGLKILKKINNIKFVLTDIVMPEMDGFEFYTKATQLYKNLKIIFTSGYPLSHPEIKKLIDGHVKFIQKPFSIDELTEVLTNLLI